MAKGREPLLLDANVVIDYAISDLGVLGLVARHIGHVHVVRSVLDEVEQIQEADCGRLGIAIVEPSLEQLVAAGAAQRDRLSFTDRLSLTVAHDSGWTCVTNDRALRKACGQLEVPVWWGLELMLALIRAGELVTQRLPVVASRAELATRVGWFLAALVWCVVGLFVSFARPEQPLARLAFASALATGLVVFQIGVAQGGLLWQPLHVVLWYHFFARFPTGAVLRGAWKAVLLALYGVGSVLAVLGFAHHAVFLLGGPDAPFFV